jgi:hypothetical protein
MALRTKYAIVVLIGATASLIWLLAFSPIFYALYVFLGSPPEPTATLRVALILQSFLMGAIPASIVPFIARVRSAAPALLYAAVIAFSAIGFAAVLSEPALALNHLQSVGFWAFVLGSLAAFLGVARSGSPHNKSLEPTR